MCGDMAETEYELECYGSVIRKSAVGSRPAAQATLLTHMHSTCSHGLLPLASRVRWVRRTDADGRRSTWAVVVGGGDEGQPHHRVVEVGKK